MCKLSNYYVKNNTSNKGCTTTIEIGYTITMVGRNKIKIMAFMADYT